MPTQLNDCGCCDGITADIPAGLTNRPGLSHVNYRVGTQADFLQSALAFLSDAEFPALRSLTTRETDDFTIALLDGWATLADVFTFYQERIANESWLRTATERDSIVRLAQLIGYRLQPGVAASAPLAFLLDQTPGAPNELTLDIGTKVQSVPGPNETAQTFETIAAIDARTIWNRLTPQTSAPQLLSNTLEQLYLQGVDTKLQPGDAIVMVGNDRENNIDSALWEFRLLKTVTALPNEKQTLVAWEDGLTKFPASLGAADARVFALRQRAALFGNNAPDWISMPESIRMAYDPANYTTSTEWPGFKIQNNQLDLDAVYSKIVADSWVVLTKPLYAQLHKVSSLTSVSRAQFALSAKITRITPDRPPTLVPLRSATVYVQSEQLTLGTAPITDPVAGGSVILSAQVDDLAKGRLLLFSGVDSATGETLNNVVQVVSSASANGLTSLEFASLSVPSPPQSYRRDNLVIYGNVAPATQGETVSEVLGSGNASQPNQSFKLKQTPLTYVAASVPGGAQSTLQIRVNNLLWQEVPTLFERGPRDRILVTEMADDGSVTVRFGDGICGARLPSGSQNVSATYRRGIGLAGLVRQGQLTTLLTRPPGLKSVTNPIAAEGAQDPQSFSDAQTNAPITMLTLDRVVSLSDYEDFTRNYAGFAKALATWTWDGRARGVFLSVAGPNGATIADPLAQQLIDAIHHSGDPFVPIRVASYEERLFKLSAQILVESDYESDLVFSAIEDALRAQFSFAARYFGEPVEMSEVIALIQSIAGVVAVNLKALYRTGSAPILNSRLEANLPNDGNPDSLGVAELLTIDPGPIDLEAMP
ncbi:MAG TPA: putative baseplate assembly protein [Chthoniobacterales bacterium]|jgi:predicted phage baseplate assembly protein